jgi:Ca2+-binding EF-hand superfamily protein
VQALGNANQSSCEGTLYCEGMAFRFVDMDGDGSMSFQEARPQGMTEAIFKAIDTSGDGNISSSEFRQFVVNFDRTSRAEAKAAAAATAAEPHRLLSAAERSGELETDTVEFEGETFEFTSYAGDGEMTLLEAMMNGMVRPLGFTPFGGNKRMENHGMGSPSALSCLCCVTSSVQ